MELLDYVLYASSAILNIAKLFSKEDVPINSPMSNILERIHIFSTSLKTLDISIFSKNIFTKLIIKKMVLCNFLFSYFFIGHLCFLLCKLSIHMLYLCFSRIIFSSSIIWNSLYNLNTNPLLYTLQISSPCLSLI